MYTNRRENVLIVLYTTISTSAKRTFAIAFLFLRKLLARFILKHILNKKRVFLFGFDNL